MYLLCTTYVGGSLARSKCLQEVSRKRDTIWVAHIGLASPASRRGNLSSHYLVHLIFGEQVRASILSNNKKGAKVITKRCQQCGAKFGLIRHAFMRGQFCCKSCAETYKRAWQKRHQWLGWLMTENSSARWPHTP